MENFRVREKSDGKGGTETLRSGDLCRITTKFVRVLMTHSSNTCDTHGSADPPQLRGLCHPRTLCWELVDEKGNSMTCCTIRPIRNRRSRCAPRSIPGTSLRICTLRPTAWNPAISRASTCSLPAESRAACPRSFLSPCCTARRRTAPRKCPTSKSAAILSHTSKWARSLTGNTCSPKITPRFIYSSPPRCIAWTPSFKLGGPVFEGVTEDIKVWPDSQGRTSWLGRFLDYLKAHKRIQDLAFMSFEHYPYDGCETPWENLYQEPELITHIMKVWRDDGLPPGIPLLDTETNDHGGEAAVDIFGALWLADSFGGFLSAGGESTHYYHDLSYSPPHPACANSWGTYHMFMVNDHYEIQQPTSQFFAAQLITQEWAAAERRRTPAIPCLQRCERFAGKCAGDCLRAAAAGRSVVAHAHQQRSRAMRMR